MRTAARPPAGFGIYVLLALCACTLLAAHLPGQGATGSQLPQLLNRAATLSKQGDFDGAVEAYRQAIKISPNDPMLRLYLGLSLENKGSYPEAAQTYEDGIALLLGQKAMLSLLSKMYLHASSAYLMMNRLDDANDRADKSLQLIPNAADALSLKGVILEMQGRLDEAITFDRKAFAMEPRSPVYAQDLAAALQKKGDSSGAQAVAQAGLKSNPRDADLLTAYGNALLAGNQPAEAEAAYRRSLTEHPYNPSVLYNLADALRRQKKLSGSLEALQKAHALAPNDADITLALGSVLVEMNRPQDAFPFLVSARQSGKYDALSSYAMAYALERESHPSQAIDFAEDALRSKPDFPQAIALKVDLLLEENQIQDATRLLTPALAAYPESAELKNAAGLLAVRQHNARQAEVYFQHALALKPDFNDALVNHAISLTLLDRPAEALAEFNQALQAEPRNLKAQSNLAQALFILRRFSEASDAFARAIALSPGDPDLHTDRGVALEKAGHSDEARAEYAEAKKLSASGNKSPAPASQ
jgi:protein O-GlcNAc transferase